MYKPKSLTLKYVLISLVIAGFIAAFIWSSYLLTGHIEGEAERLNHAGKLRYRAFELAWYNEKIAEKETVREDEAAREMYIASLRKDMEEFESNLSVLRTMHLVRWLTDEGHLPIAEAFGIIEKKWTGEMRPVLLAVLELPPDASERTIRTVTMGYNEKVHEFVDHINKLVSLIEENYRQELEDYGRLRFFMLAALFWASAAIIMYVRKSIIGPLRLLKDAVQEVRSGNLEARLAVQTDDEIGMLGRAFNEMTGRLKEDFEEKSGRMQELDILNEIARAASASLSMEMMLSRVMDAIMGLKPLRLEKKGAIFSCDHAGRTLRLEVSRNFSDAQKAGCGTVSFGECLCGICAGTGETVMSASNKDDPRHTKVYPGGQEHGHIILPLKARDRLNGVLCLYLSAGARLTEGEAGLYASIADIIAVSMENARAHREIGALAASLEQKVQERTSELRDAHGELNRLFNAIEQSAESIIITDPDGTILYVNPAFTERSGYGREEAIGNNPRILKSEMTPPGVYEDLWSTIRAGGVWRGTLVNRKKSGDIYWENVTISPVIDGEGRIANFVAVKADITERIRHEEELRERNLELEFSRQQAEAANRAKSDFLANMSHELRTPLNAIIGFSEVVRDGMAGPVSVEQKEYLDDVLSSGRHLLSLVNDILDLSKVEAGRMELELSEFGVKELVEGCLALFKERVLKRRIRIGTEVPEDIGDMVGDERKIRQVLFNLLGNAIKFTPEGGSVSVHARRVQRPEFTVQGHEENHTEQRTLNVEPSRDFIEISVADTGIGIAEEDLKKLFLPFLQIETALSKKYEGTGLGLALCRKFVELHGGRIWVESEVGKGSRFVFAIPVTQSSETGMQNEK